MIQDVFNLAFNNFGSTTVGSVLLSPVDSLFSGFGYVIQSFFFVAGELFIAIISYLPTGGAFPVIFHTSAEVLGRYLNFLEPVLPVEALFQCVTVILGFNIALLAFRVFLRFWYFVRGATYMTIINRYD